MWDLKPFSIYTLCLLEKIMFFQYEIKNLFDFNTSTQKNKIISFQCGIKKKPFEIIF